jgi:hypothetical protein
MMSDYVRCTMYHYHLYCSPLKFLTPAQAEIAQNLQHHGLRKSGESAACVLVDLCGLG